MAEVVWTEEAERWLLKIHDYIAKDSPAAAFHVVQSIHERAQILERFPDLGHGYTSPSGREARILLWGHYRIVYPQGTQRSSGWPRLAACDDRRDKVDTGEEVSVGVIERRNRWHFLSGAT